MPKEVNAYQCKVCEAVYLKEIAAEHCESRSIDTALPVGTVLFNSETREYILITNNIIEPQTHNILSENIRFSIHGDVRKGFSIPSMCGLLDHKKMDDFVKRVEKYIIISEKDRDNLPERLLQHSDKIGLELKLEEDSYRVDGSDV